MQGRAGPDRARRDQFTPITHGVLSGPAVERVENSVMKSLVITDSIEPTDIVEHQEHPHRSGRTDVRAGDPEHLERHLGQFAVRGRYAGPIYEEKLCPVARPTTSIPMKNPGPCGAGVLSCRRSRASAPARKFDLRAAILDHASGPARGRDWPPAGGGASCIQIVRSLGEQASASATTPGTASAWRKMSTMSTSSSCGMVCRLG